jgi:hypothetical protein
VLLLLIANVFVVVIGLQASPIFAYVMMLLFPLMMAPLIICKACKTTTSINPSLNLVNNKEKIKFTFLLFYWEKSKEKMTQKYDLNLKQKRRWNNILDDVVCWGCDDGLKDLY